MIKNKIVIIDGNSLIYRAYYGTAPNGATFISRSASGVPTNALTTFIKMIEPVIFDAKYVLIAFDSRTETFRHKNFEDYKGTRKATPNELIQQFKLIYDFLDLRGISHYYKNGYEADDVIAAVAKKFKEEEIDVEIYSSDRDLLQLTSKGITIKLIKKGMKDIISYTDKNFYELMNMKVEQFLDFKVMVGDSSDNIKGIDGIGTKTAVKLLNEYGSLDEVYNNLSDLTPKLKENLLKFRDFLEMTRVLVKLNSNFDTKLIVGDLEKKSFDSNKLYKYLGTYGIRSFKLKEEEGRQENLEVESSLKIEEINKKIDDGSIVVYIQEGKGYHEASRVTISIGLRETMSILDVETFFLKKEIIDYLKNPNKKIYTNSSKALSYLAQTKGIEIIASIFDIMLAASILLWSTPITTTKLLSEYPRNGFKDVDRIFSLAKSKKEDRVEALEFITSYYGSISEKIEEALKMNSEKSNYYDLEKDIPFVLASMELKGIMIDRVFLEEMKEKLINQTNGLVDAVHLLSDTDDSFNIDSPMQVARLLFDKLGLKKVKKTSTDIKVLEKLKDSHEVVSLIIEYRKQKKILTTYITPFLEKADKWSRIHPYFHQLKVTTGRIATTNPSIQNIATRDIEQREIKKGLIAPEGKILIAADYSQIELRILAHLSNDEVLLKAFKTDSDIHSTTAALIFGKDISEISNIERSIAKTINFGVIYGMGSFKLSEQLHITIKQASKFIEAYFNTYKGVKDYQEKTIESCKENNYVTTILGRRRYLYDINASNVHVRKAAEREAINSRIQGTQAEIIKKAMVEIGKILDGKTLWMIGQIHDELIFEVDESSVSEHVEMIRKVMTNCFKLKVPIKVNIKTGKTWKDLK